MSRRLNDKRYESDQVWSMYGKVRVQLTVQEVNVPDERETTLAGHYTRWEAIKFAARIVRRALGRLA